MKVLVLLTFLVPFGMLRMLAIGSTKFPGPKAPFIQERSFPYQGTTFNSFVSDSFKVAGSGQASDFYDWFDQQLTAKVGKTWPEWIEETSKSAKAHPRATGEELHRLIKKTITKFSLDRGFEFFYTVSKGERQCFLQSILIAGILQRAGLDAGVAMVYRNIAGEPSFNGHAVCVLNLGNGRDILVDASEPMASPKHVGLFLYDSVRKRYQYVEPRYQGEEIVSYRRADDGTTISVGDAKMLDIPFLESQFDYYRGERAIGGILASEPTDEGLKASAGFFGKSIQECPNNPLSVYMLGRTYAKLNKHSEAKKEYESAMGLCEAYGWVPNGLKSALK